MIKKYHDISLKGRNTFGIDARCRELIEFETPEDLQELFGSGDCEGKSSTQGNCEGVGSGKWRVLSGGSNIVFTGDFDGTLLHPVANTIEVTGSEGDKVFVRAEAGADWDRFVQWCVGNGLWGAENLSYIPGLVGACPVQNIGAYGVEAKDIIHTVEMFDVTSRSMVTLAKEHCGFGYRSSIFKGALNGRVIITAVNFVLSRSAGPKLGYGDLNNRVQEYGGPTLANIRDAVVAIRREKLPEPEICGNAGSFFKNPVVPAELAAGLKETYPSMPLYPAVEPGMSKLAAGWLIDQSGWKGRGIGNVGVHDKQALVLVNLGGATGNEVMALAQAVCDDVQAKFGVRLETEVNVF